MQDQRADAELKAQRRQVRHVAAKTLIPAKAGIHVAAINPGFRYDGTESVLLFRSRHESHARPPSDLSLRLLLNCNTHRRMDGLRAFGDVIYQQALFILSRHNLCCLRFLLPGESEAMDSLQSSYHLGVVWPLQVVQSDGVL